MKAVWKAIVMAILRNKNLYSLVLPISILLGLTLYLSHKSQTLNFPPTTTRYSSSKLTNYAPSRTDSCTSRYIYVHNLPNRFNSDMLHKCHGLAMHTDMCKYIVNSGFGPVVSETEGVLSETSWYATDQFMIEVIFHKRIKQYKCLTTNSSMAKAIYVPFYAGLDIGRHLIGYNVSVRDSLSNELIRWLKSTPEWQKKNGRDHFTVAGRVAWDLKRAKDDDAYWGGKFLLLPETRNMTVLSIEINPWENHEFGIPFPTYFHPSKKSEIISWQEKVRSSRRPWLFTFVGARRTNQAATNIRDRVVDMCEESKLCKLQSCGSKVKNCNSPGSVMRSFLSSKFCLQPPGDAYTRKSTFDSMIAGCIPVFFHLWSAHDQYKWYLPRNYTTYSVYIPEKEVRKGNVIIEDILLKYTKKEVRDLREELVKLIPQLVYKDYKSSKVEKFRDAFDVVLDHVIEGEIEKDESPL
ncbi:hypothetical protein LUZ60_015276 [Juncus effusus]|nr:hypothetical protein LUZ60_015276 [Juncus effusus]